MLCCEDAGCQVWGSALSGEGSAVKSSSAKQRAAVLPQHCADPAGWKATERGAASHLYAPLAEHGQRTHDVVMTVALQGVVNRWFLSKGSDLSMHGAKPQGVGVRAVVGVIWPQPATDVHLSQMFARVPAALIVCPRR